MTDILPLDCWVEILSKIHDGKDIASVSKTCSLFNNIVSENTEKITLPNSNIIINDVKFKRFNRLKSFDGYIKCIGNYAFKIHNAQFIFEKDQDINKWIEYWTQITRHEFYEVNHHIYVNVYSKLCHVLSLIKGKILLGCHQSYAIANLLAKRYKKLIISKSYIDIKEINKYCPKIRRLEVHWEQFEQLGFELLLNTNITELILAKNDVVEPYKMERFIRTLYKNNNKCERKVKITIPIPKYSLNYLIEIFPNVEQITVIGIDKISIFNGIKLIPYKSNYSN